jgi:molybdopterin-binding protein
MRFAPARIDGSGKNRVKGLHLVIRAHRWEDFSAAARLSPIFLRRWEFCFLWIPGLNRRILCRMTLSARNRLEGRVVEIQFGGVMAHVVMRVGKSFIESVITKRSADEMKLKVGDKVSAVIKSTEVMLEKD